MTNKKEVQLTNEKKYKNQREKYKKNELYFYIYNQIRKGLSPSQLIGDYDLTKQKINYYINGLKALNVIKKISYGVWKVEKDLTEVQLLNEFKLKKYKLFSKGSRNRPETNLHALQIKIPILEGKINDSDWKVKEKLKNWIPKYTKLPELGGLRIKNNNNKSITVWAKEREVQDLNEINKLTHAILIYLGSYFKVKYKVELDTINAEVKNLDLATEDKAAESMRRPGEKYLLNLNKDCEKILPQDKPKPAKAWIDGSPFNFSAETNDLEWKREYLNMPFNIKHLAYSLPALDEYNKNLKLHIKVQEEQLKTQKAIQKALQKLTSL